MLPNHCTLCPRACCANRAAGLKGFCGAGDELQAALACLHHGEEPCISGEPDTGPGSGTVFFSGCTLRCGYCQNYPISQGGVGKAITQQRLSEIFWELQAKGARNLNLVTATQWLPWVLPALDEARRRGVTLPVVYNTSGYETEPTVLTLAPYVDIWLTDWKYASSQRSLRFSGASDYPEICEAALRQMLTQTGAFTFDEDGFLKKGVLVRHLVLPGQVSDSLEVLERLADLREKTGVPFLLSLLRQFTPCYHADQLGLHRKVTSYEYRKVVDRAVSLGLIDGYTQDASSATEEYTPTFDFAGI